MAGKRPQAPHGRCVEQGLRQVGVEDGQPIITGRKPGRR
jgi:hypothetical protein